MYGREPLRSRGAGESWWAGSFFYCLERLCTAACGLDENDCPQFG